MNAGPDILPAGLITKHSYQVICRYHMQHWYAGREVSHPEQAAERFYHDNQNDIQLLTDIKYKHIDEIACDTQYMLSFIMSKSSLTISIKC